ncbi:AGC protein kinase, variant [Aphanomyces invadans]|nr:AGC protein kinase, variant [Aphanomyces invadans]ETV94244.1 AGC protein kinase, variant [Aphanomyces invadans]|eukprot:XP_008877005.1 AGC protein kinase, variant [Aphanomyces invadans]
MLACDFDSVAPKFQPKYMNHHACSNNPVIPSDEVVPLEALTVDEDDESDDPPREVHFPDPEYCINHVSGFLCDRVTGARIMDSAILNSEAMLTNVIAYVHARMSVELGFVQHSIPYAGAPASCQFFASKNYSVTKKLLVFVCSSRGSTCGIWSRSLLLRSGVNVGSMLPYFRKALDKGFGVVVLNPNVNSVVVPESNAKVAIPSSSTPEEHIQHVWENYIYPSAALEIHFLAYGYGGVLVSNLIFNPTVMANLQPRLGNLGFLECQTSNKCPPDLQHFIGPRWVSWEPSNDTGFGKEIRRGPTHASTVGITMSAGPKSGSSSVTQTVLDSVFRFFDAPNAHDFVRTEARWHNVNVVDKFLNRNHVPGRTVPVKKSSMTVDDFDLLKVLGKGAFGKVLLVRRKSTGATYAMKVLKKEHVVAKSQVEHTRTERKLLQDIDHPFIVRLRYAFQNSGSLYLVMDYYAGGTLFHILRQQRRFKEHQAKLYGAQLVLAFTHLHSCDIVFRDLKLENILMDSEGFIALADFGLSKEHVKLEHDAMTFCGTPEYLAPELLRRKPYGKVVDWWSFGIVMYEMLSGSTPFYNTNRKKNFYNILHEPLDLSSKYFSDAARSLLRGLLTRKPHLRLGFHGGTEVMAHPFFADVPWDKVYKRQVLPSFVPNIVAPPRPSELDDIPSSVKNGADYTMPDDHVDAFANFTYRCTEQIDNVRPSDIHQHAQTHHF